MTPHWSHGDLEAGLDDLERFFTQLEEYRDLDAATLEAQIRVQLGRGEPKHYEQLHPDELEDLRSRLLFAALWQRKCRYFAGRPDCPLSAADGLGAQKAAAWITSFFPDEDLPSEGPQVLIDQTHRVGPSFWPDRARWFIAVLGGLDGMVMRRRFFDFYTEWLDEPHGEFTTDGAEFHRWMRAQRDGVDYTPVFDHQERHRLWGAAARRRFDAER
jgi:hypothetical protein